MKNIKTKIWALLGTTIMLLPFVLSLGTADVSAAVSPTPENVTVNLHKLKFTSAPENQINNGTELTFPNSEPLNGCRIKIWILFGIILERFVVVSVFLIGLISNDINEYFLKLR